MSNVGTTYNSKLLVVYRYMHIARHKACLRESLIPTMAFVIGSEILCFFSKTYLEVIGSCCCCVCAKTSESFYTVSRIFGSKQLAYSRIVPKNIPVLTFIFRKCPKLKKGFIIHIYCLLSELWDISFVCLLNYKKENKIEHYLVLY